MLRARAPCCPLPQPPRGRILRRARSALCFRGPGGRVLCRNAETRTEPTRRLGDAETRRTRDANLQPRSPCLLPRVPASPHLRVSRSLKTASTPQRSAVPPPPRPSRGRVREKPALQVSLSPAPVPPRRLPSHPTATRNQQTNPANENR